MTKGTHRSSSFGMKCVPGFRQWLVGDDGNSDNSFAVHICNFLSEVIDCFSTFVIGQCIIDHIAEAPMIAKSIASSVNVFPKACHCPVPRKHSGQNSLKGFKRRFDMMWFVIFIPLLSLYAIACWPLGLRRYRSFCYASWLL